MQIRLLVTGGTFDKEYDEITDKLYFKDTHVREMLRLGRARTARHWPPSHTRTITLKPPQNIRLPSNGIVFGSIIFARRGSAITFLSTLSRCLRDL